MAKPPIKVRVRNAARKRQAQAQAVRREPMLLGVWLRAALLRMWRLRGGGFYGLGFVATFVGLQLRSLFEDAAAATGPIDFVTTQLSEALLRVLGDTFPNLIQAFVWPALFVGWSGAYGLLVLLATFLVFDRWIKPWLNERFPEPAIEADT